MNLCVTLYAVQTLLVGGNARHPRLSLGAPVKAKCCLSREARLRGNPAKK